MGDVDHLFGDDSGLRVFVLRHQLAGLSAVDGDIGRASGDGLGGADVAVIFRFHRARRDPVETALGDPIGADRRQAGLQVDIDAGIGVDAGAIVGAIGFFPSGRVERDFAEGDPNVGAAFGAGVDFPRSDNRASGDRVRAGGGLRLDRHGPLLRNICGRETDGRRVWNFPRPYAGMTRFRFKGHRAAGCPVVTVSQPPAAGLPSVNADCAAGRARSQTIRKNPFRVHFSLTVPHHNPALETPQTVAKMLARHELRELIDDRDRIQP